MKIFALFNIGIFTLFLVSDSGICNKKMESVNSDSMLVIKIRSIEKNSYLGKPMDSILSSPMFPNYISTKIIEEPLFYLSRVMVSYSRNVWIEIYLDSLSESKVYNGKRNWDIKSLGNEIVTRIKFLHNSEVIGYLK